MFPLSLCVTKMSGTGSDSVFLGVMRPLPPSRCVCARACVRVRVFPRVCACVYLLLVEIA